MAEGKSFELPVCSVKHLLIQTLAGQQMGNVVRSAHFDDGPSLRKNWKDS